MGFVSHPRADRLGFFVIDDLLEVAAAVKGIQAIASSAQSAFGAGGKSTDEQRMARAAYFGQSALAGSVTAARYLLGGTQNTASHEIPYYQAWINKLAGDATGAEVLAEAEAQGPKWAAGVPDPGGTQQMFNDVKQDLVALGQPAPAAPGVPGTAVVPTSTPASRLPSNIVPRPQVLAPMVTTAPYTPYNWTPWLVAAGGGLAIAAAVGAGRRRSARRIR